MEDSGRADDWARTKVWTALAFAGTPVGPVLSFIGVITDAFSLGVRIVICTVGGGVYLLGALATYAGQRSQSADQREIQSLRTKLADVGGLDVSAPDHALRLLVPLLF